MASIRFRTVSGSTYELDEREGTWCRVPTLGSGNLRSETGRGRIARALVIGEPAVIFGPRIVPGADARIIATSVVVSVEGLD